MGTFRPLLFLGLAALLVMVAGDAISTQPDSTPSVQPSKKPAPLKPGAPVEYKELAMFPERWQKRGVATRMVPWTGSRVALLTTNAQFDPAVMGGFVGRLDAAWKLYSDLTGRKPRPLRQLHGKPTIAAVPGADLTCGQGCGYVGLTGIEVAGFYDHDYPSFVSNSRAFAHYYFYEMARNYYTFGDRHSLWITGFAVFMRYVCMDALRCTDPDSATRLRIEEMEELYSKSTLSFLEAFTTLGGMDEKTPRIKDRLGNAVNPSDQPVMYASVMLKLRRECGGDPWLKRFCAELIKCPEIKPDSKDAALRQSFSWLVAASCAARRDLSGLFVQRWHLPLPPRTAKALAKVAWKNPQTNAAAVIASFSDPFAP